MELPKRKPNRLENYDYSQNGAYFLTICVRDRRPILSQISVGAGLAPPAVRLLPCGEIAKEQLMALEERYPGVRIDQYVIMPNHIHILMSIRKTGGASPAPTVSNVVGAFKSLTARACAKRVRTEKLFQRSFYDHVIRDEADYEIKWRYIEENPLRWCDDELYAAESNPPER